MLAFYSADSDKIPSLQYELHTLSEKPLAYAKSDAPHDRRVLCVGAALHPGDREFGFE